jgi:hypothetical protein
LILPDDAAQTPGVDVQLNENQCPQIDVQLSENEYPQLDMQPTDAPQIPGVDGDNTPNDTPQIPGVDGDKKQPINPPQIAATEPVTIQREAMENAQHLVPALRRSARSRNKPTTYTPTMSGSKYSYAITQLQNEEVLYPDAHMFLQNDFNQAEPNVVAVAMTQLSLKAGLKEWGDKAYETVESEMKQLHFRNTFEPMHWRQLSHTQRQTVLESHMFLKEKRDGNFKVELWQEETNNAITSPRRTPVLRLSLPNPSS